MTDKMKIIEVKQSVFADNDADAEKLRKELKSEKTFLLNLMSAPGSGKTTTLVQTINRLEKDLKIGVMEADIDSDVDAYTIAEKTNAKSIQLHTGGMCHLDADMTRQGVKELDTKDLDLAILENVGNLVCPAEFDTGIRNPIVYRSGIKRKYLLHRSVVTFQHVYTNACFLPNIHHRDTGQSFFF